MQPSSSQVQSLIKPTFLHNILFSQCLPDDMENFVLVDLDQLVAYMEVPDSVDHSFDSLEHFDSINCTKILFLKILMVGLKFQGVNEHSIYILI